jgi:hypothetical protein
MGCVVTTRQLACKGKLRLQNAVTKLQEIKMNKIKDWINRFSKQDGIYLTKEKLIQEIRKTSKSSFPIEYKSGTGLLIVAIPVPTNFQI